MPSGTLWALIGSAKPDRLWARGQTRFAYLILPLYCSQNVFETATNLNSDLSVEKFTREIYGDLTSGYSNYAHYRHSGCMM